MQQDIDMHNHLGYIVAMNAAPVIASYAHLAWLEQLGSDCGSRFGHCSSRLNLIQRTVSGTLELLANIQDLPCELGNFE